MRLAEFKNDPLALLWPVTILLIPTAGYGISRILLTKTLQQLDANSIYLHQYRLNFFIRFNDRIDLTILLLVWTLPLFSLVRYHNHSKQTWLNRSTAFHLTRLVMFDYVVTYFGAITLLGWLDIITAMFRLLQDGGREYDIFSPDLMYGLQPVYRVVNALTLTLLVTSFLPSIILFREGNERHSWTYLFETYVGLLFSGIVGVALIWSFNQRLGEIQESALQSARQQLNLGLQTMVIYYQFVSLLPGVYPVPILIGYLSGIRGFVLFFEIYNLLTPELQRITVTEAMSRLAKRLIE